ncbi:MAG: thioesterase family protein [Casimicrobiaceae bacterium]
MTDPTPFSLTVPARWGDMDFNAHMANTAYLDLAAETRFAYFETQGFAAGEFVRHGIGPVVREDVLTYFAEIRLREPVRVTLECAALAADGARFRLRNIFYRADAKIAARLLTTGGWLDLKLRRLAVPPDALREAMANLARTEDFTVLAAKAHP